MNYLVKRELARGLPQLKFWQEGLCENSKKKKLKRATHKSKVVNSNIKPHYIIHIDFMAL